MYRLVNKGAGVTLQLAGHWTVYGYVVPTPIIALSGNS